MNLDHEVGAVEMGLQRRAAAWSRAGAIAACSSAVTSLPAVSPNQRDQGGVNCASRLAASWSTASVAVPSNSRSVFFSPGTVARTNPSRWGSAKS